MADWKWQMADCDLQIGDYRLFFNLQFPICHLQSPQVAQALSPFL